MFAFYLSFIQMPRSQRSTRQQRVRECLRHEPALQVKWDEVELKGKNLYVIAPWIYCIVVMRASTLLLEVALVSSESCVATRVSFGEWQKGRSATLLAGYRISCGVWMASNANFFRLLMLSERSKVSFVAFRPNLICRGGFLRFINALCVSQASGDVDSAVRSFSWYLRGGNRESLTFAKFD